VCRGGDLGSHEIGSLLSLVAGVELSSSVCNVLFFDSSSKIYMIVTVSDRSGDGDPGVATKTIEHRWGTNLLL
jgi:hypothetical protein